MTAPARRIRFPGGGGDELAARLDLPAGPPRAFALFAHCFTCSADLGALRRLASGLTERGIAVLRFDFTGLGSSDGEFANTDFTSNVDDLVAAADWLRERHRAPQLLVGHSLGGAAVVVAARQLPEVRAVVTIGAPSDTEHLMHLFEASLDDIAAAGRADVEVAGRRFTVGAQFVDDLRRHTVTDCAAEIDAALLVLHSPDDEVVDIEHAGRLYGAAAHPKSLVGLDGADHLLDRPADAAFAASLIAAWAERYLADESGVVDPPSPSKVPAQVMVAETTQGAYLNHVVAGRHRFLADEPVAIGGFDAGPTPYDLLSAALGACTSMTLRMYADRKGLPLDRVVVEVTHGRVHADDADDPDDAENGTTGASGVSGRHRHQIDHFERVVHLEGDLDEAVTERLLQIADRCPVHRTLESSARISTRLA